MQNDLTISFRECVDNVAHELDRPELFFGHGTDNPCDEAYWLVSAVIAPDSDDDIAADRPVTAAQQQRIAALLARRVSEQRPLAYLLQHAWFCGYCFYVDERVLVPRSPIAELIDQGFQPLVKNPPARILDLCCGSGCIGIAAALTLPDSQVVLADISDDALAVADINIARFALQQRVVTRQANVFSGLEGHFDLILANPPYVSTEEYRALPQEYHLEPALGLVSADAGLAIPAQILAQAADYLSEEGILILETGYTWPQLDAAFESLPFLWLAFEFGGEGVCALTAAQLRQHAASQTLGQG